MSIATAAGLLLGSLAVAGSVVALGGQSSDEAALAPTRTAADRGIERKVNALLARMTTAEKLQQVQLLSDGQITDADAKAGVGGVFSLTDPEKIDHYQRIAVEQSRLHIPILFAYDTIHGYRTIFPIPLGAASSFDPDVAKADATIGARESATVGIKQIYSPMVDVSHEPRWGRIAEGAGEDPYLNSVMAAARVKGAQGNDYSARDKVVTSVKHYVGYGQPEGGRDYNTTDMSEQRLRNLYLPPFKAAIDAGADTVMCSFNSINGVPGCANSYTETTILKKQWGFDGFIESDYTAVAETRACPPRTPDEGPCGHGTAADGPQAAANALMAGTDSEMVSTYIRDYGKQLLADGRISRARLDDAVRRILRVKFRAGLFDHPYVDQTKATDPASFLTDDDRAAARQAAGKSMVLLKNDEDVLPLDPSRSTAVIGPLGDSAHDMLGPWWGKGEDDDAVSVLTGIKAQAGGSVTYTPGCEVADVDPPDNTVAGECGSDDGFDAAVAAAQGADQVVLAVGEARGMSGEAASRSDITLPGLQEELIRRIEATGKPVAVVLFNGRPLDLSDVVDDAPAILEAWFPGVEAGNAVADVLFGEVDPGGKLPVTFPQRVGQVPIYYNHEPTGRPCDVTQKYTSRYRDLRTCDPLFPFGFGLSYTTFDVSDLSLSRSTMSRSGTVTVSMKVTNTGDVAGDEVAQLYLHDPVASISQPVRRLVGFERVSLDPGESTTVQFHLDRDDVGFYDNRGKFVVETGRIDLYAGSDSTATDSASLTVTR
ncbi:beta-glucosidase BglX [Nocardioides mangrovi]|uniref:Beta-glucosidase BglX n=1 Tax=Nocardioides mangrovi TaxID=2874580 RepID=A0ABS7U6U7_9ACTN|nr:beta-glucosidase BglX [Nocardioides mangrovi]MBZ5736565.1 beta-glucosidase BglX [Nocardioides mangrovi]